MSNNTRAALWAVAVAALWLFGCAPESSESEGEMTDEDGIGRFIETLGATGATEAAELAVDPARSGTVSSWYGVSAGGQRVKVGGGGWLAPTYKAVLSFDTSSIPDDAEVVGLLLVFDADLDAQPEEFNSYFEEHLRAELAGPDGFGGSTALTAGDYYAVAAGSAPFAYNPAIGYPIMPPEVLPLVNRQGVTQIRLAFAANPERYLVEFGLTEAGHEPSIVVVWEPSGGCSCEGEGASPVCGDDDVTYPSACEAECAAAPVRHDGPCGIEGDRCDGSTGAACIDGRKCRYGESLFDLPSPDAVGVCVAIDYCDAPADCAGLEAGECVTGGTWSCEANRCTYACDAEPGWVREEVSFGTPRPYRNLSWITQRFDGPAGATAVRVSFSRFSTEAGHDTVTLYDSSWMPAHVYSGALGPFVSEPVSGSSVTVAFFSDWSVNADGFAVDAVEFLVE